MRKIADVLKDGDSVLTHCNVSGELAMAAHLAKEARQTRSFSPPKRGLTFQRLKIDSLGIAAYGR